MLGKFEHVKISASARTRTEILLPACIFENFRRVRLNTYATWTRFYKRCSALRSCRTLHANNIQTFVRCGFTLEKCISDGIARASVRGVTATLGLQIRKPFEL